VFPLLVNSQEAVRLPLAEGYSHDYHHGGRKQTKKKPLAKLLFEARASIPRESEAAPYFALRVGAPLTTDLTGEAKSPLSGSA